jgi:hypothetical protein
LGGPLAVKTHGTHEPNVASVDTELIELFKDNLYGYATKIGLPLRRDETDGVIKGNGNLGLRADQFGQRLMVDWCIECIAHCLGRIRESRQRRRILAYNPGPFR